MHEPTPTEPGPADAPRARKRAPLWGCVAAVMAVVLAVAVAAGVLIWQARPRVDEERVRELVQTTLRREAPAAFYVTGYLDLTATTTASNDLVFLPGLLDLNVGSAEAVVRVPGRVSYGFDVRLLQASMIRVDRAADPPVVEVTIPDLSVLSVEPDLSEMRVRTSRGWLRNPGDVRRVERRALARVQDVMRRQAEAHLRDSTQPRVNTARALERLLTPVLEAAGVAEPRFRFRLGRGVVVEPER